MPVSLASLLTPVTEEEALDLALTTLGSLGFNVTSWQEGSVQRTLVQLAATLLSSVSVTVGQIAAGGFNGTAVGGWLDLLSQDFFQNTRVDAVPTQGVFRLTASPTAPPATILVGDLQVADTATSTASTQTYRNTTGGVLAPGGVLDLDVEAETAGAAGNIPNGTPLYMWTALVGVTATNPAIGATTSWRTRAGADAETDTRLRDRNASRWSTLSYAAVDGAYRNWVFEADDTVTRVKVRSNNPFGPGTIDVVCATDSGGISPAQEAAILAYIYGTTDGVGRRPLGDVVTVRTADTTGGIVTGTVTVDAAYTATTTAGAIQAALLAVTNSAPIGGTIVPPASSGVVVKSKLIKAVEALPGVISVVLTDPGTDIPLTDLQIIDPALVNFVGLAVVYG